MKNNILGFLIMFVTALLCYTCIRFHLHFLLFVIYGVTFILINVAFAINKLNNKNIIEEKIEIDGELK